MAIEQMLKEHSEKLALHLNERQRRLVAAADARGIGYGGVMQVSRAFGLSRQAIYDGMRDLDSGEVLASRARRPGGGRKKISERHPEILQELELLVEPDTRGDPMTPLRWTCKSIRRLAGALKERGYPVGASWVRQALKEQHYSLQGNAKTLEGSAHPDRDQQFRYIHDLAKGFIARGLPVISVDTKKKELVGNYRNAGKQWRPAGEPLKVKVHDFVDPQLGKAIPYGIYDVGQNIGWGNVGTDHDTASFAVESIGRWWRSMGQPLYPHAQELLICADSGGSNGYRVRLWKVELQRFAEATGLALTVCHLPPGTSKWNKIEHRLFSHISMNWRGRPLISHQVIVNLIAQTTTTKGLKVTAQLDRNLYPPKVKVTKEQMASIHIQPHSFHGEWNYTLAPAKLSRPLQV